MLLYCNANVNNHLIFRSDFQECTFWVYKSFGLYNSLLKVLFEDSTTLIMVVRTRQNRYRYSNLNLTIFFLSFSLTFQIFISNQKTVSKIEFCVKESIEWWSSIFTWTHNCTCMKCIPDICKYLVNEFFISYGYLFHDRWFVPRETLHRLCILCVRFCVWTLIANQLSPECNQNMFSLNFTQYFLSHLYNDGITKNIEWVWIGVFTETKKLISDLIACIFDE